MAIRIYIDQGHNPYNPNAGAEGNGLREQDIVYRIGQDTAALLRENGRFDVRLSRPTPTTVLGTSNASSLAARVQDANAWGANYFLSLHTNASELPAATGCEAFSFARDTPAFFLGEDILDALQANTGLRNRGMFVRPSLYVLKRTTMPAVLLELGFITNRFDAELMVTRPELFARGICDGVLAFTGVT